MVYTRRVWEVDSHSRARPTLPPHPDGARGGLEQRRHADGASVGRIVGGFRGRTCLFLGQYDRNYTLTYNAASRANSNGHLEDDVRYRQCHLQRRGPAVAKLSSTEHYRSTLVHFRRPQSGVCCRHNKSGLAGRSINMEKSVQVREQREGQSSCCLCVDLDGTLVRTDTLLELALRLLRIAPWRVVFIPLWILRGKAYFKRKLSQSVPLAFDSLPYHQEFLDYLRRESQGGRRLVLASGADLIIAQGVADHLGLFEHVLASDGETNLVGPRKTAAIRTLLGGQGFVYAGNSSDDMDIWMNSDGAILVNAPHSYRAQLERRGKNVLHVLPAKRSWLSYLKALRPHQWSKNSLVFVPLVLAHKISDVSLVLQAVAGFFAFSFAASALYILNDLLDLEADRNHPRKKRRPFASGALSIPTGFVLMLGLVVDERVPLHSIAPPGCIAVGRLLPELARVLALSQAAAVYRCCIARDFLHRAGRLRRRGHRNSDFHLDAGLFHVPVPEPRAHEAYFRIAVADVRRRVAGLRARLRDGRCGSILGSLRR